MHAIVGISLLLPHSKVLELSHGWFLAILLSHLEVLSEVLVSAPEVGEDLIDILVSSNLMEVRVSKIVLGSNSWHSSVLVWLGVIWSVHTDGKLIESISIVLLGLANE